MECERMISNWLLELYHVKQEIASSLDSQLEKTQNQELHNKIEREIEDILGQSELIKKRVEELDRDILTSNSELVNWVRDAESMVTSNEADNALRFTIVKQTLMSLERSIIQAVSIAAGECEDENTISLCEKLLEAEREIAESLDQELHDVITDLLNKTTSEKSSIDFDEGRF